MWRWALMVWLCSRVALADLCAPSQPQMETQGKARAGWRPELHPHCGAPSPPKGGTAALVAEAASQTPQAPALGPALSAQACLWDTPFFLGGRG